jgi:hypothetical protein
VTRAATIKQGYTTGARTLASRSVTGLTRTRVTPNALTTSGVLLCAAASVLVLFEGRNELVFYWLAALVLAPGGVLPWSLVLLACTAWVTVGQRVLHVRKQLMEASRNE